MNGIRRRASRRRVERAVLVGTASVCLVVATVLALPGVAAPGDLDPTFGTWGIAQTDMGFEGDDEALGTALQSDGRIIVAGTTMLVGDYHASIARYRSDGSLDASFGTTGVATTNFGVEFSQGRALAVQADDKIVAVGRVFAGESTSDFGVARFSPDGNLDGGFGEDGFVVTDLGGAIESAEAVAVQSDGKIVVGGNTVLDGYGLVCAVARYDPDGSLDQTFGDDGMVITADGCDVILDLMIVPGPPDTIVAVGLGPTRAIIARYDATGNLDVTFGTGGLATIPVGDESAAYSVALQPDGKIVAAGVVFRYGSPIEIDWWISRHNSDGALDTTFDADGMVIPEIGPASGEAQGVAVRSDGRIVAVGNVFDSSGSDFAAVRLDPSGAFDTGFGSGGVVITDLGSPYEGASDLVLQADGKAVAVGLGFSSAGEDFTLVRYQDLTPCTILGTPGDDTITGTQGDDVICVFGGDDIVLGLKGNDLIFGGEGHDRLFGGPGNDSLEGEAGDDRLTGQAGIDLLSGDDGADLLKARDDSAGNDRLDGGAGDDVCQSDEGDPIVSCP